MCTMWLVQSSCIQADWGVGDREMSDDPGVCQLAHQVLDLLRRAASWQWRSTVAMETNASRLSCVVLSWIPAVTRAVNLCPKAAICPLVSIV